MAKQKKETDFNKETRSDIFTIDPRKIIPDHSFNVRIDYGDLEQLEEQILQAGAIKNPVRIHAATDTNGKRIKDRYYLTDGYRRHKAAMNIFEKTGEVIMIPAIKEPRGYKDEERFFDMVLLNDGKPLTAIEEAEAYRRLLEGGYTEKAIVARVGKSAAHVNNLVKLINAPDEIRNLVHEGTISSTLAIETLRKYKDGDEAVKIIKEAKDQADDSTAIRGRSQGKVTKKMIEGAERKRLGEDDKDFDDTPDASSLQNTDPPNEAASGIKILNSVREVKQFAKLVDEDDVPDEKLEVYSLIVGIANNEIRIDDLNKYFKITG